MYSGPHGALGAQSALCNLFVAYESQKQAERSSNQDANTGRAHPTIQALEETCISVSCPCIYRSARQAYVERDEHPNISTGLQAIRKVWSLNNRQVVKGNVKNPIVSPLKTLIGPRDRP